VRSESDRERLKVTFESEVGTYQVFRPEYPPELFDDLIIRADLPSGSEVLEVGSATGKTTIPLASRGLRMTCVELSPVLAAELQRNTSGLAEVVVETAEFETWNPRDRTFEAIVAANSWHWLDPATSYEKASRVLRPSGRLARSLFDSSVRVSFRTSDPRSRRQVYSRSSTSVTSTGNRSMTLRDPSDC
jgi:SAM-dependent methyltransferase